MGGLRRKNRKRHGGYRSTCQPSNPWLVADNRDAADHLVQHRCQVTAVEKLLLK